MAEKQKAGQQWASVIRMGVDDREAEAVVNAINAVTARREAKSGAVMIACTQVLAQCITQAPLDVATEVRAGILALIDGFAMQSATQERRDV